MRRNILTLLIAIFALSAFAQGNNEQVSHVKKIRHTFFWKDDAMTESDFRYDDQHITHYFYDANGNKILERKRIYNANRTTTYISYQYNEKNLLVEKIDGNTRYAYSYNEDGTMSRSEKYNLGEISESVNYEYTNGLLTKESKFNSNNELSLYYVYEYDNNGVVTNRLKYNKNDQKTGNMGYEYDNAGRLIAECDTSVRASGSSAGMISGATRVVYTYDEQGRLYEETNETATISKTEGITGWTGKEKYIYMYEGTSNKLTLKEIYQWSTDKEKFEIYEHDEYTTSNRYGSEYLPQNINITLGTSITKVPVTLEKPANSDNLVGYQVIADNVLLDTVYTTESFFIENQVKGTHQYRIFALYDSIAATASDATELTIEVVLASPTNAVIESQEYSGTAYGWSISFTFTPPVYSEELTLTGYRYKVTGGNGGKTGTADAKTEKIAFSQLYPNTIDNEKNLCTVELFAVYAEGESDPLTFELDLRDTENQIIVKWRNERSERTDANGVLLDSKHYYYTSNATGEVLESTIDYDADNNPTLRYTSIEGTDYTEKWNAETMQWEKYSIKERESETFDVGETIYNYITTKVYDAESDSYIATEKVKRHSICTMETGYRVVLVSTSNYTYENGEEVLTSYIKHYATNDYSFAADTLFAADMTTITGLIEYNYYATFNKDYGYLLTQTLTSQDTYRYENGKFVKIETMEQTTNYQTQLVTTSTVSSVDEAGNKTLVETTTYVASKEYGRIKAPTNIAFDGSILSWSLPSNRNMIPTGYRIFVNNIPYADTEETSIKIENIPNGRFTFTVMSLYNGSESSYLTSVTADYKNNELTYDLPLPTPDYPEYNSVNTKDADSIELKFSFDRNVYAQDTENMAYAEYVEDGTKYNVTLAVDENDNSKWTFSMEWSTDYPMGNYRFVFPAGTFGDETAFASDFTSGMVNAEFAFTYILSYTAVESIENDVVIRVENRNIIAPAEAKVYNLQGIESGKENVAPGVYVVTYQNTVTKLHVR